MKNKWLVSKFVDLDPFTNSSFTKYLAPHSTGMWSDNRSEALRFGFFTAIWCAIWHWAWIERDVK